jgi:hypothetical protein
MCTNFDNYFEIKTGGINTRNNNLFLKLPKVKLEFVKQSFYYLGAKIYNDLPIEIKWGDYDQWWKSRWGRGASTPHLRGKWRIFGHLTYKRAKNSLFECKWGGGGGGCRKFESFVGNLEGFPPPTGKSQFPPPIMTNFLSYWKTIINRYMWTVFLTDFIFKFLKDFCNR